MDGVPGLGFAPLTPTSFLRRSELVFGNEVAIVDGDQTTTYAEFATRARWLTGLLSARGVGPGDRVAALCTNSRLMLELHNGVPMRGAVLVALNTRLSVDELVHIVRHSGAGLMFATIELVEKARMVAARCGVPLVVEDEYDDELKNAGQDPVDLDDERGMLAINYTSGTTGRPKGVVYHHRGAYLQSLAMAFHAGLGSSSRYLWTLPMFHCNGWCFTWAITAAGGTHVCMRQIDPEQIWSLLREERITHLSGAPAVLRMISEAQAAAGPPLDHRVHVDTGGAPPTPTLLRRLESLRMSVQHLYGLTETFGPVVVNQWRARWSDLADDEVARLKARQGVGNVIAEPVRVVTPDGADVPTDGVTVGEIAVRGNDVMLGYFRDDEATREACLDDAFLTGDLAVVHPDGYLEIVDRRKDVIITGGENVSSVEVERALESHSAVVECAVIGVPDERWGELVTAYVVVRDPNETTPEVLDAFLRGRLAGFKVPKRFVYADIPKTSTGKVQKHLLRKQAVGSTVSD